MLRNVYVVYKKTSDSKYYLVKINDDDSVTAITELPELATGNNPELVRILTDNSGNVYALKQAESYVYTLYKYNSSGVLQVTKILTSDEMFGFIAADGYLYTMIYNDDKIHKRNLSDLETIENINLTTGDRYYHLCFDSDGYLYTYNRDYPGESAFEKWELGVGLLEFHQQALGIITTWSNWALLGDNIAIQQQSAGFYIINKALDSDAIPWAMNDIPASQIIRIGNNINYWYALGENTADDKLIVEKYNSSKVLQATIEISSDYITGANRKYTNAIAACPFVFSPTVTTQAVTEY